MANFTKLGDYSSQTKHGEECVKGSVQLDKRGPKPRYYIKIYDRGKQLVISIDKTTNTSFKSKAHANKALVLIQSEIEKGVFDSDQWKKNKQIGRGLTFRQYKRQWLKRREEQCQNGLIVPRTLKDEKTHIEKYLDPKFGRTPLVMISFHKIEVFHANLPLSNSGKYNVTATLRKILRDAQADRILAVIPRFPKLGSKKSDEPKQFMLPHDQDMVIGAIPIKDRPIFHMLRQFGLRPGEARAIHKSSIRNGELFIEWSFSENILRNTTKTGVARSYILTPFIQKVLSNLPVSSSKFLFDRGDGNAYTSKQLNRIWRKACIDAGVPHMRMYTAFRHSLARNLLEQGHGFDIVAEVLGHKSVEMTRSYYADMPKTRIHSALNDISQSQDWISR